MTDYEYTDTFQYRMERWVHYRVQSVRFFFQRLSRGGWDDSATWSLDDHLAPIILPRLKRFKELNQHAWPGEQADGSGPKTWEEWQGMLDAMIFAFEWDCDEERKYYSDYSEETYKKVEEGHLLFGKWFNALWD